MNRTSHRCRRAHPIPSAARCWLAPCAAAALISLCTRTVGAQPVLLLDRTEVIRRAATQSPTIGPALEHIDVARAQRIGASVFVRDNPALSVSGGPRLLANGVWVPDFIVGIAWPFDLGGQGSARSLVADASVRVARARADEVRANAVADALDVWLRAIAARARVDLAAAQLALDATALRIATTRRTAGAGADDDVALARLAHAAARARLAVAAGDAAALEQELLGMLRLVGTTPHALPARLPLDSPASLDLLIANLGRRPVLRRLGAEIEWATRDLRLQERLGLPVPRVTLAVGRENEWWGRAGVELPLPVFQRNQTAVAVGHAQIGFGRAQRDAAWAIAETELRTAYARYVGARASLAPLDEGVEAAVDAEHLVLRAYELGQRDLAATLVAFREAAAVRLARLEAQLAVARALVAIERAAGVL